MNERWSTRVTDDVHQQLRDDIVRGVLAPGTRLSVPALAARLEVSRSPVRDAVGRLVQERLAREEPRRGAVVARVGLRDLAVLYEVREVLEGLAARLAVENSGKRLVRALHETMDDHEKSVAADDMEQHMTHDLHFHALIRDAAGNAEVKRLLDDIQTQVRLAMQTTTITAGPKRALADHRVLLEAIEAGDPGAAEQAARAHIARLRRSLFERADDEVVAG